MLKLLPYIALIGAVLGILGYTYWKGGEIKEQSIENKDLKETVKDQEELNEIRLNRPDDDALLDSLLDGSF